MVFSYIVFLLTISRRRDATMVLQPLKLNPGSVNTWVGGATRLRRMGEKNFLSHSQRPGVKCLVAPLSQAVCNTYTQEKIMEMKNREKLNSTCNMEAISPPDYRPVSWRPAKSLLFKQIHAR